MLPARIAITPHKPRMMTGSVQPLRRMLNSSRNPVKAEISTISWIAGRAAFTSVYPAPSKDSPLEITSS